MSNDVRESPRYRETAIARVKRLADRPVEGCLRDISSTGLSLALAAPLKIAESVLIRLSTPEIHVNLPACVVHVTPVESTGSFLVGFKLRRGISPANLSELQKWQASHFTPVDG